jgi:hypothetical protein
MFATSVVLFLVLGFANLILLSKLLEHRTDLPRGENPYGGPSWSWQVNVLFRATYDERGKRLKPWLWVGLALQMLALVAALKSAPL